MNMRVTFLLSVLLCSVTANALAARPNVILIMTDDQGYGDPGCHGNPVLNTPNLDRLYRESVRLTELDMLSLAKNTILIFMTDNGTANGAKFTGLTSEAVEGYNAGMRGKKSSVYEGGHRVPFYIHWPAGGLAGGRDVSSLSAHIDVLATLAELCGVSVPESHASDGVSFAAQLKDSKAPAARDHLVVQFQGGPQFNAAPTKAVVFETDVPAGKTKLETWLIDEKGEAGGAYFTEVEALIPAK